MFNKLSGVCEVIKGSSLVRKEKLEESFQYHKFLVHYRDLAMELERLDTVCAADKEARDLTEAALFVDQHVQFKVIIITISLYYYQ